jgi:hypothetical protein
LRDPKFNPQLGSLEPARAYRAQQIWLDTRSAGVIACAVWK